MINIKSIIYMHNKEVITEKKTQAAKCNCINKLDCPPSNQCQITNIIKQTFQTIMKEYTTEPAKVHLNSVMKTIRNHLTTKIIGQIQNFRRNTGGLKNSKHNLKYNFVFQKDVDQQKEQVFVLYI